MKPPGVSVSLCVAVRKRYRSDDVWHVPGETSALLPIGGNEEEVENPREVSKDVMATDWNNITLAEACKLTDAEPCEVIGMLVCQRIRSCWDCPVGLMSGRWEVGKSVCREALGRKLLEKEGKHENKQRSSSRGRSKGLA